MLPIPASWAALACAACLAFGAAGGASWVQRGHAATAGQAAAKQATTALAVERQQGTASAKAATGYVAKLETIKAPAPVIAARIKRAARRVQRPPSDNALPVPAQHPAESCDGEAAPDTDHGLVDRLAAEIPDAVANKAQLEYLQELVRANAAAH